MTAQDMSVAAAPAASATPSAKLDGAAAAFGVSVSVAILCNTVVTAIAETWPSLDSYIANWTGNPWRTHGIADVLVFLLLGYALMNRRFAIGGRTLAFVLFCSVVLSAVGLGFWAARP